MPIPAPSAFTTLAINTVVQALKTCLPVRKVGNFYSWFSNAGPLLKNRFRSSKEILPSRQHAFYFSSIEAQAALLIPVKTCRETTHSFVLVLTTAENDATFMRTHFHVLIWIVELSFQSSRYKRTKTCTQIQPFAVIVLTQTIDAYAARAISKVKHVLSIIHTFVSDEHEGSL